MNIKENTKIDAKVIKVVYSGVLIALGILLPQAFHMFGQNAGMTFLPIHIPILLAGLLLGPYYGLVVGIIVPILSSILTGMPPVPKLYFMVIELAVYGVAIGFLMKRFPIYISLIGAMLAGRCCYGLALIGGITLLHIQAPFANQTAFWSGILSGIPGIGIQLIAIPAIYFGLKRAGLLI
ncbi:ECF transporter S component [Lachnospiraceae bacterium LCP25S3_G4]